MSLSDKMFLKGFIRISYLVILLCVVSQRSFCQGTGETGQVLPFSTSDLHHDYSINLHNLAVRLDVPVLKKNGPMPFQFGLALETSYSPGRIGHNADGSLFFGLFASEQFINTSTGPGGISYTSGQYPCPAGSSEPFTTVYANFTITEPDGTSHFFDPHNAFVDKENCYSQNANAITLDGSGYSLNVTFVPNTVLANRFTGTLTFIVTDKSGRKTTEVVKDGDLDAIAHPVSVTLTDANNNSIQWSAPRPGGPFTGTDSLGTAAIVESLTITPPTIVDTYIDSQGNSQAVNISTATFALKTSFNCPNLFDYGFENELAAVGLPTKFLLPDSTHFDVSYEQSPGFTTWQGLPAITGRIASIGLPSGAAISFQYSGGTNGINCADGSAAHLEEGTPDGTWKYDHTASQPGSATSSTTVTDPQGNQTVYTFSGTYEVEHRIYEGSSSDGKLLERVVTCYTTDPSCSAPAVPISQIGWSNGLATITTQNNFTVGQHVTFYNLQTAKFLNGITGVVSSATSSQFTANVALFVPTTNTAPAPGPDSTGYVEGIPEERDSYTYLGSMSEASSVATTYNSIGLVVRERHYDFGGGPSNNVGLISDKTTTYGTYNNGICSDVSATIKDRPCIVTVIDGQGNIQSQVTSSYDSAGNVLETDALISPGVTATKKFSYDAFGVMHSLTDPNGNVTTYTNTACNNRFPTTIARSGLSVQKTWNCNGAIETSDTDANGNVTQYKYDLLWRRTLTSFPDGGQASTTYNLTQSPPNIVQTQLIDTLGKSVTKKIIVDSLYRPSQSIVTSDPEGASTIDYSYQYLDLIATKSNAHRSSAASTDGITGYTYDAMGRLIQTKKPDGSVTTTDYFIANCPLSKDEAGFQRRVCYDGQGRLIEADEPGDPFPGSPASATVNIGGPGLQSKTISQPPIPATGSITIRGQEQTVIIPPPPTCKPPRPCGLIATPVLGVSPAVVGTVISDIGSVSVTVNGHTDTVSFGSPSTVSSLATNLANAIRTNSPYVDYTSVVINNTTPPSATIFLQARGGGIGTDYPLSSGYSFDQTDFAASSFTTSTSGPSLIGGQDTIRNAQILVDSGTVTVKVGAISAQASFGLQSNHLPEDIATALANSFNAQNPPFIAKNVGTSVTIKWNAIGTDPNGTPIIGTTVWDNADFPNPSFIASGDNVADGSGPEPPGIDHPFVTLFTYDAADNLTCIEQHGNAATGVGCPSSPFTSDSLPVQPDPTNTWRRRLFAYDSLSRLLWTSNPETGAISYSYDPNGNVLQKMSPAPNADSSSTAVQTISYCYDGSDRVTGKGYGMQACPLTNPVVTYTYDAGVNGKAMLTSVIDQMGSASYGYDAMGRLLTETRVLSSPVPSGGADHSSISKSMSYEYNLDGSLAKLHYPSNAVVTYAATAAGRTGSAIDQGNSINYVTGPASAGNIVTFTPGGLPTNFISGNSPTFSGIVGSFTYNNRLQPVKLSAVAGSQTVYSIGYDFHLGDGTVGSDNGDVWNVINYKDSSRNQTFSYDLFNRLSSAQNAGTNCSQTTSDNKTVFWGNSYAYDAWGNLITKAITKCGAENLPASADANNRLHALSGLDYKYDAAGNMVYDAMAQANYVFDQENRVIGVNGYAYSYDAFGDRVMKSNGNTAGNGTLYWYMTPGIVAESDLSGTLKSEYTFFNGNRVARRDLTVVGFAGATPIYGTANIAYYFSDRLKTAAVITDSSGNVTAESDFTPWGGEVRLANGDLNHYKFSGKERDTESYLDYFGARYYSNVLGRWITADWSAVPKPVPYANLSDPQSFNLYSYVRNSPASQYDVDGHCEKDEIWCQRWYNWRTYGHFVSDTNLDKAFSKGEIGRMKDAMRIWNTVIPDYETGNLIPIDEWVKGKSNVEIANAYKEAEDKHGSESLAIMTQWGWQYTKPYNQAVKQLRTVNTDNGTIDVENINGKIPTEEEARQLVEDAGGRITRGPEKSVPGGVSPHDYLHFNYEVEINGTSYKGTIRIQE